MFELCCPECATILPSIQQDDLTCTACGKKIPSVLGIPDLRGSSIVSGVGDDRLVPLLLDAYPSSTYEELVDLRIRNDPNAHHAPTALLQHISTYTATQKQRGQEMVAMFQTRLQKKYRLREQRCALDIGCGSGASLLVLSGLYERVAGIDPGLPNLILARKTLDENNLENVLLVQAYGQKLPFNDEIFDYVNALNVLEHVFDLAGVLMEIRRVLARGGGFAADSRNRFDLIFPEPHARIRWLGLLPRKWAPAYVRWRCKIDYDSTYLLSYFDLRRGMETFFKGSYSITYPDVETYGGHAWVDRVIHTLDRIPLLRELGLWFFPSHLVLAHSPGRNDVRN